jgi:two-component system NtrC family sensor kinase
MNIAVVGGGVRCQILIELIEKHIISELNPKIIAVADIINDAPGFLKAKEMGLFTTNDYNDFFDRDDIDLIIELTGNNEIFFDILSKKKKGVRAINHRTARLFWEVGVSSIHEQNNEELKKTKTMYRLVIDDLIQEDVMVIDLNYRILDINDTLLAKLGLERENVIGHYCYKISHHQDMPCSGGEHPCPLAEVKKTYEKARTTHIHLDKGGQKIYFSISCHPLFENNQLVGVAEVSKDITEDIKWKKALMQQDKLVSIGRLSAGVAHEINNPLTTILTTSMLIQEDLAPNDPIRQELETIVKESLRCRKIVSSLLDFARESKPTKTEHHINELIVETLTLTRKQAAFKDVGLLQNLAENLPLIQVDRDQLQQALINLILNAAEATDPGGTVTISTKFYPQTKEVEIAISDLGKGISEETLPNIFDPFFTTKESGTGLGLAITHGIIERHEGTISVQSQTGIGTTFTIRLPINKGNNDVH